jgi:hypothetical protein
MIPAHIPERLRACVTTHRIMDDVLSPVQSAARNFELIRTALESIPVGTMFSAGDIRKAAGEFVCWDSIRNHLSTEVVRRSVVTYKTGKNRYYKRVA